MRAHFSLKTNVCLNKARINTFKAAHFKPPEEETCEHIFLKTNVSLKIHINTFKAATF